MKKTTTYRPWVAGLLAVLIVQVTLLRDLHHLLPHQHEERAHCDSETAHLHSSEYAHVSCLLCTFHFAPVTLDFHEISINTPVAALFRNPFFYQKPIAQRANWHFLLRGPPASAA